MPKDTRASHEIARESVNRIAQELGLELESQFVPFSQSRNASGDSAMGGKPWESLNWKVTLKQNGREILRTDYSQGTAHCPAHKSGARKGASRAMISSAVALEIETGERAQWDFSDRAYSSRKPIPGPEIADVLYSLAMDSDVLDYPCFDDWAECFGYDTDSRKAESTYKACLAHALALRNGIGNARLVELQEAAREM